MGHVAVGEHHQIDPLGREQILQLRLGHDLNAVGIERPRQLHRIASTRDAGNLSGSGERYNLDAGVVAIGGIEVVEVASSGSHDHDTCAIHGSGPSAVAP